MIRALSYGRAGSSGQRHRMGPAGRRTGLLGICAAVLLGVLFSGGCGYRQGTLYRQDIQTVAVPICTNRTFQRGLEVALTQAVVNRLEATTPYKVVPAQRADAILEMEITAANLKSVVRDFQTNLPREQALTLSVDLVFKDLRSGQILCQRRDFQYTAFYYPTLGEGQFVGNQQAVERLALAIVQELGADW